LRYLKQTYIYIYIYVYTFNACHYHARHSKSFLFTAAPAAIPVHDRLLTSPNCSIFDSDIYSFMACGLCMCLCVAVSVSRNMLHRPSLAESAPWHFQIPDVVYSHLSSYTPECEIPLCAWTSIKFPSPQLSLSKCPDTSQFSLPLLHLQLLPSRQR
jgi:hypothetical protein